MYYLETIIYIAAFKYLSCPRLILSSSSATSLHSRRMSSACLALRGVILTLKGALPSDCAGIFVVSIGWPLTSDLGSSRSIQGPLRNQSNKEALKTPYTYS